ncbi:hypothetical protein D3C78_1247480 [compost metagenome]
MGQARAADQHVRRVRMVQRRQDAPLRQQFGIVMADAQPQALHLLFKACARLDRRQCQIANAARVLHFADQTVVDHADTAFAVTQFELNQTHEISPIPSKTPQISVGVSLLAIAMYQSPTTLAVPTLSRAGSLLHWISVHLLQIDRLAGRVCVPAGDRQRQSESGRTPSPRRGNTSRTQDCRCIP